jgi:hypothetical protein
VCPVAAAEEGVVFKFVDGCAKLVDGCAKLVDGCAKLVDGCAKLVDGCAKLVDGATVMSGDPAVALGRNAVAVGAGPKGSCCGWKPGEAVGTLGVGGFVVLLAAPGTRIACDFPPAATAGPIATAEMSAREPKKRVVRMVQSPVYLSLHP